MTTQYVIVFLIITAALAWVAYKMLFKKDKTMSSGCCGCALADQCKDKEKKHKKKSERKC